MEEEERDRNKNLLWRIFFVSLDRTDCYKKYNSAYQRSFVWAEEQVKHLISSFNENNFIPPVTIGAFKENNKVVNYILDSQQRLASIILASIGFFPDIEKFNEAKDSFANENDDNEIDSSNSDKPIEWTFAELLKSESIKEIKNLITVDKKYKHIDDYQTVTRRTQKLRLEVQLENGIKVLNLSFYDVEKQDWSMEEKKYMEKVNLHKIA